METCQVEGCNEPVMIGVGNPVRWVCFLHFNEYLGEVSAIIKAARRAGV